MGNGPRVLPEETLEEWMKRTSESSVPASVRRLGWALSQPNTTLKTHFEYVDDPEVRRG